MLKKLFQFLAILCLLSVAGYVLMLYYNTDITFALPKKASITENADKVLSENNKTTQQQQEQEIKQAEDKEEKLDNLEKKEEGAQKPGDLTEGLKPCPDFPPNLVGPLDVNFNVRHTMEDAKELAIDFIQEGGRYKPSDCVALQKVAIIIPFRNRYEHLNHWLYYLHPILKRQQVDYGVYVINQDGEGVFNRAKLLNVGYVEALKEYDYDCFLFSDVDLIPMDDRNLCRCFENPRHLAVAMDKFNFALPYNTYFGGVSSLSKDQFLKINGFPNTFWGWGGEDDDIYSRIIFRGMSISRPDYLTGKYKMAKHNRDLHNEPNPANPNKLLQTQWTMDKDGLNTLEYTVKKIEKDLLYTFITVDINAPA